MHAVTRTYSGSGARELFDLLEERASEVESMMQSIEGFRSYVLVRTAEGGTSVTVCDEKAGVDESVRRAKAWIEENASALRAGAPIISEGPVILYSKESRLEPSMPAPGVRA
jgi:hypothetical protein